MASIWTAVDSVCRSVPELRLLGRPGGGLRGAAAGGGVSDWSYPSSQCSEGVAVPSRSDLTRRSLRSRPLLEIPSTWCEMLADDLLELREGCSVSCVVSTSNFGRADPQPLDFEGNMSSVPYGLADWRGSRGR